ncbi:MAG: hypothetical protein HY242_14385 [Afipia sp.]|nr:hypothetical protein [Afipia sp.]
MTDDNASDRISLRQAAVASLKSAIARLRERQEMDDLGEAELERLAHEVGLSPRELRASAGANGDWIRLLELRLEQFEFEKSDLLKSHPRVVRDLEQTCARCGSSSRCNKEFAEPGSKDAISGYCPNTHTLQALETERERRDQNA